jgi:hypothetical protein
MLAGGRVLDPVAVGQNHCATVCHAGAWPAIPPRPEVRGFSRSIR